MPEVIYDDADVLLLNKPAGMLSQKANPSDVSVVDYITEYVPRSGQVFETDLHTFHPGTVTGWTGIHPDLLQRVRVLQVCRS